MPGITHNPTDWAELVKKVVLGSTRIGIKS